MEKFELDDRTKDRLASLGVAVAYLFGSVAEGTDSQLSDLDIGVVLRDPARLAGDTSTMYTELYDALTDAFPGKELDIVFLQNAGLEVCMDATTHGHVLFAASAEDRYAFEERIMIEYADFRPLLEDFNKAVLGRI